MSSTFQGMLERIRTRFKEYQEREVCPVEDEEACLSELQETIQALQAIENDLWKPKKEQEQKKQKTEKEEKVKALQNRIEEVENEIRALLPDGFVCKERIGYGFRPQNVWDRKEYYKILMMNADLMASKSKRFDKNQFMLFLENPPQLYDKDVFDTCLVGLLDVKFDLLFELRVLQAGS